MTKFLSHMPGWMPEKQHPPRMIFYMWQQATGWNHSSMALMLDPALKAMDLLQPCTQFTHDYMHGVLQGTGPTVLFHFISAMEEILHIYQFLEGYFAHWVFPRSWKSQHIGSYFAKKNDQP